MSATDMVLPDKPNKNILEANDSIPAHDTKLPIFGIRHKQIILLTLIIFMIYSMRINLSLTIVAMTDPTSNPNPEIPTYNWTDKSIILSAYLWTYGLPQLGVGSLVNFYGPKWFLVGTILTSSSCTIVTPYMAQTFGSKGVMVVRASQGLAESFLYSSIHAFLSNWAPQSERSRLCTYVYSSRALGVVVSTSISGLISSSCYGWPMSYYLFGSLGLVSGLLFVYYGYNSPEDHHKVSIQERMHIRGTCNQSADKFKKIATPWRKVLTSAPLWGIVFAQSVSTFSYWTTTAQVPRYVNKIMKFDIKSNGFISALPNLIEYIGSFVVSYSADYIINTKFLSIEATRKIYTALGILIPTIAFVYLGNSDISNVQIAIVFLILSMSGFVFVNCGYMVNHLDIAPNHAGTLMGLTNGIANIVGLTSPLAVQFIVKDETNPVHWGTIFYITASVNVFGCIMYTYLASGSIQEWNTSSGNSKDETDLELLRNVSSKRT